MTAPRAHCACGAFLFLCGCPGGFREENGQVSARNVPLDYYGDLRSEYEARNADYIHARGKERKP